MRTFAPINRWHRRAVTARDPILGEVIIEANAEFKTRLKDISDLLVAITENGKNMNAVAEPTGSNNERIPVRLDRAVFDPLSTQNPN